jgi:DNA-binding transcriptional MocR family regulator
MSNFQNPLGALMPNEKKRELVAMLAKNNVPLIEDDVYAELYDQGSFCTVGPSPKVSHQVPASDG